MAEDLIPLADAIRALREELEDAVAESTDKAIRFVAGPVEFEFEAVVSRESGGGGKVSFKLLGIGAEASLSGKLSGQRVQKLKIVLKPVDAQGKGDVLISRRRRGTATKEPTGGTE
jgi:hypothetical protein